MNHQNERQKIYTASAFDSDGRMIWLAFQAPSERLARERIHARGLILESLHERSHEESHVPRASHSSRKLFVLSEKTENFFIGMTGVSTLINGLFQVCIGEHIWLGILCLLVGGWAVGGLLWRKYDTNKHGR